MTNLPRGNEPSDCELFWGALIKRESSTKRQKENSKNFNSTLSETNLRADVSRPTLANEVIVKGGLSCKQKGFFADNSEFQEEVLGKLSR